MIKAAGANPHESKLPAELLTLSEYSGLVVVVSGELDNTTGPHLRRRIGQMLERPLDALLLDLSGLESMDSAGLVALIDASDDAAARDIDLVLSAVPDHALQEIERTNAGTLLRILDADTQRPSDERD